VYLSEQKKLEKTKYFNFHTNSTLLLKNCTKTSALFAWLISHQPAVLFSQNKSATSYQPAILFSQNKPAPAISHQPNEQCVCCLSELLTFHADRTRVGS
jgi:hypothetical protein